MSRLLVTLGLAAAALAGIAAVPPDASAQAYPNRPVRFVVPFPPGGGADMTARTISPRMSEALGQPIVIENRAGAGGHVATEYVSKAAPDGYTILLTNNGIAIQPHLSRVTWDPIKDFAPERSRRVLIATVVPCSISRARASVESALWTPVTMPSTSRCGVVSVLPR